MSLGLLGCALQPARAAEAVEIQYGLSLAGLPIGTAQLAGTFDRDTYKLDVKARMTGLAGLLSTGKGAGNSMGTMAAGRVIPSTYALASGSAEKPVSVRMALTAGTVANLAIDPPIDARVDRVPLLDVHKKDVVDPISGLLMPLPTSAGLMDKSACERVIPVFDGAGRFDIKLSYAGTKKLNVPGYAGDALVCAVRYTPVAGHRVGRKATEFMAENKDIDVWLAPVDGQRALLPVRISVRTMIGTVVIEANRVTGLKPSQRSAN